MRKVFSTSGVYPRDRFEFWHESACGLLVPHTSKPLQREQFSGEVEAGAIGDIGLVSLTTSAQEAAHRAEHIRESTTDDVFVGRVAEGVVSMEQHNREATLHAGELVVIDPMLPYTIKSSADSKLLIIKVSRRALEARVGVIRDVILRPTKSSIPEQVIASSFIGMLPAYADRLSDAAALVVENQSLDLLSVAICAGMNKGVPRVSSAKSLALLNLRATIETHLSDPDFSPASAAAAAGITVRYANALLAGENTSLSRVIQARRLARCRRAMDDPTQACRTLSEIAFAWGFSDMTHFSRTFKKAYGILPSEYRRLPPAARARIVGPDG